MAEIKPQKKEFEYDFRKAHRGISDIELEMLVTDMIQEIMIPAHIKGYHYLRDILIYSYNNYDIGISMTKVLYPMIADKYNTTPSNVERAIRQAIISACKRGAINVLHEKYGYAAKDTRPTNSELIAMLLDKLHLWMKER